MEGHCLTHRLEMISHALPLAHEFRHSMPSIPSDVLMRLAQASVRSRQIAETIILKNHIKNGLPI